MEFKNWLENNDDNLVNKIVSCCRLVFPNSKIEQSDAQYMKIINVYTETHHLILNVFGTDVWVAFGALNSNKYTTVNQSLQSGSLQFLKSLGQLAKMAKEMEISFYYSGFPGKFGNPNDPHGISQRKRIYDRLTR